MDDCEKYNYRFIVDVDGDISTNRIALEKFVADFTYDAEANISTYTGSLLELIRWVYIANVVFGMDLIQPVATRQYKWMGKKRHSPGQKNVKPAELSNLLKIEIDYFRSICALTTNNERYLSLDHITDLRSVKKFLREFYEQGLAMADELTQGELGVQTSVYKRESLDFTSNYGVLHYLEDIGMTGRAVTTKTLMDKFPNWPTHLGGYVQIEASPAVVSLFLNMEASEGNTIAASSPFKYWPRLITQPSVNTRLVGDNLEKIWNPQLPLDDSEQQMIATAFGKKDYLSLTEDAYYVYPYTKDSAEGKQEVPEDSLISPVFQQGELGMETMKSTIAHPLKKEDVLSLWSNFWGAEAAGFYEFGDIMFNKVKDYHVAVLLYAKFIEKFSLAFNGLSHMTDVWKLYFHLLKVVFDIPNKADNRNLHKALLPRSPQALRYDIWLMMQVVWNGRCGIMDGLQRMTAATYSLVGRKPETVWTQGYEFGAHRFDELGKPDYTVVGEIGKFRVIFRYSPEFEQDQPISDEMMTKLRTHSGKIQKGRSLMDATGIADFLNNTVRSMGKTQHAYMTVPPEIKNRDVLPNVANEGWLKKNIEVVCGLWEDLDNQVIALQQIRKLCENTATRAQFVSSMEESILHGSKSSRGGITNKPINRPTPPAAFLVLIMATYVYHTDRKDNSKDIVSTFVSTSGRNVGSQVRTMLIDHYKPRVICSNLKSEERGKEVLQSSFGSVYDSFSDEMEVSDLLSKFVCHVSIFLWILTTNIPNRTCFLRIGTTR